MSGEVIAWIDESGSNAAEDPDTYIMSAAITTGHQLLAVRSTMSELLLPGQAKLHWRNEQAKRRNQISDTIAAIDIEHLVVVTSPHRKGHKPERRRRLTLEVLLPELGALGVHQVILESRGPKDDQRDHQMLDYLRRQSAIDTSLKMDHRIGRSEPILWVADAVCGIVSAFRTGERHHFDKIAHRVTLTQLPPRP